MIISELNTTTKSWIMNWTPTQIFTLKTWGSSWTTNLQWQFVVIMEKGPSFLSLLPPQLCERDSCGGRWSLVQVSVSLQWPAGHKSVDTADTHGAIMWQFGHPVGEMWQAVQVLTKNDKIWTPSEQTLTEGIYDSRNIHEKKFDTLLWAIGNLYEIWPICWRARKDMK